MKKINYGGSSKILNGIVTKINAIIDSMVVDVKVNDVSVVDENHVANIDLTLADQNVKQSPTTDNADYRILLSKSANDTEETDTSRKNTNLKYNPSTGNLQATKLNGNTIPSGSDTIALTSDIPTVVNTYDGTSTDAISGIGVKAALDTLPEPMVFKGSLGTGGTISDLPMDGSATIGDTYKVITEGDYGNNTYHAEVGDTFICDSKTSSANTWTLIPSGDEPSGTVTSVTIQATSPIAVDDSTAITESGTRTISHETSGVTANSYGDSSAQTPSFGGTFKVTSATVNATGHVTAMSDHNVTIPSSVATTSANGLMSSTDKTNLDSYRAVSEIRLTNEDLDNVTTVGFYYAAGGNTVTNKPSGYNNFGLVVIHNASGSQYTQIISNEDGSHRRIKKSNGTWTSWAKDVTPSDVPTVNDGTLTITQNGTSMGTFTANQSSAGTIEVKDEKVKQTEITDDRVMKSLAIASDNTTTTDTDGVEKCNGLAMKIKKHSRPDAVHQVELCIGNDIAVGSTDNYVGTIRMFGTHEYSTLIHAGNSTDEREIVFPDADGTLALQSELPTEAVEWSEMNVLGAKNLLPCNPYNPSGYVQNGITFDVLEDGTVVADGTKTTAANNSTFNISERYENSGLFLPNGTYFLSGCPEGGGTTTYQIGAAYLNSSNTYTNYGFDNGEGVEFTVDGSRYSDDGAWVRIFITISGGYASVSDMQFKPMLRLASISDSTYTPPTMTNRNLTLSKQSWTDNMASGVKNYFPYPFEIHPKQGEVYTQRGIRWTDGGNGIIVANGTNDNTGNSYCQLLPISETSGGTKIRFCTLPAGKYHFSGGISEDYYLNLSTGLKSSPTDRTTLGEDMGSGFDFEVTEAMAQNNMFASFSFVKKGKSATDVQFKPMITRYEDSSVGFAEYAMTNKELTQYKTDMMTIATNETSGTASRAYDKNELMFWRRGLYRVTQAISSGGSITLNTNVVATTLSDEIKAIRDALSI